MEELDPSSNCDQPRNEMSKPTLAERRQQALELQNAQRQQFRQVEADLDAHFDELEQQIAVGVGDTQQRATDQETRANLDQFAQQLREQAEELTRQQAELSADRAEIASCQADLELARDQVARQRQQLSEEVRQERAELERRASELQASESKLKQAQNALAAAEEEHQSEVRQFGGRRERIDAQQLRLEKQLDELEARREETRAQRRRIAQQLRIERTALAQERELIQSEIERQRKTFQKSAGRDQTQLAKDRESFEEEMNRVRQQLRRDRQQLEDDTAALEKTRQQLDETRREAEKNRIDQSTDLLAGEQEIQRLAALLADSQRAAAAAMEKLTPLQQAYEALKLEAEHRSGEEAKEESQLQQERDTFAARVDELESQLADAKKQSTDDHVAADDQRTDELQRRFEMAVDDVRQLKRRNAQLEEELADFQAAAAAKQVSATGNGAVAYDWETTKKRLLAELDEETTHAAGSRLTEDDRLSVEGTIRITDEMIVQRDREIAELKQLLDQQSSQPATADKPTEPSAADVEAFNQDDIIRQERERLAALEKEWQGKLRQAEVEISVQRARLARERSDLDEQMRVLAAEKSALAGLQRSGQSTSANSPKKPGNRWLARLGLKENDTD